MSCAAAETVADAVAAEARRIVLEQAAAARLLDPAVAVKVVSAERRPRSCAGALEVKALDARHLGRMRFSAHCADGAGWQQGFVARAALEASVVVGMRAVPAGRPIAAEDIALAPHPVISLQDVTSDPARVVGRAGKRALRAGRAVSLGALVEPVLVRRGRSVRIVASNGPIQASTAGEALESGRLGDLVEVRNLASGRVIRARVSASEEVAPIDMPLSPASQSVP